MPTLKNPLVRKLAVVLVALWWGFVRDQRVTVNTNTVAAQLAGWLRFGA